MKHKIGQDRIIITGPVQSGKSTLAWELTRQLKENAINMAGFIARGLWKNNQRWGFDLFDLKTEQLTPLARRQATSPQLSGSKIPYIFFNEGMQAGTSSLLPANCSDAKIIMVDELGHLELQGKGWAPCIPPLLPLASAIHIWIVREKLIESVCNQWPFTRTDIFDVNEDNALKKLVYTCTKKISE